ncbi:MAG: hypothetical protein IPG50_04355 [Myxococcales bacterium]|nr:hypothetical protein [Myxococcales bacterium]
MDRQLIRRRERPRLAKRPIWPCLTGLLLSGCSHREPPSFSGDAAAQPLAAVTEARASAPSSGPRVHDAGTSPSLVPPPAPEGGTSAKGADATADATADDRDAGQTRDRPSATSAAFTARVSALFDAIREDAPLKAHPAFFPLPAYEQVKAVTNPGADYKRRLLAAFDRDIRDLHVQLGARAETARFIAIDVPDERARWVEPGEEYNRLGYYRVFGSKLRYELGGRERTIPIKSLISWRGEWYVVHLSGMK